MRLASSFTAWVGGWLSGAVAVEAQGRGVGKVTEERPYSTGDVLSSLTFPSSQGPHGSAASGCLSSYHSQGLARRLHSWRLAGPDPLVTASAFSYSVLFLSYTLLLHVAPGEMPVASCHALEDPSSICPAPGEVGAPFSLPPTVRWLLGGDMAGKHIPFS